MINQHYYRLGVEPNAIRRLFAYGLKRKSEIGAENVFDFSIGNPCIPVPEEVIASAKELVSGTGPEFHGYTPASGDPEVLRVLAKDFNERFGISATENHFYLTCGAAAALSISLSAVASPGDEVLVIAPYFPEYRVWIQEAGATCVEVLADEQDGFQLDITAIEEALTPRTSAIIINSPNNPTGVIYSEEKLRALAYLLRTKEVEYGHSIFIISDEPYREITYGSEVGFIPDYYEDTIICYSYSKSLSLPGERIGYIYVNDRMDRSLADQLIPAIAGAGRSMGYVSAPALWQRVIARSLKVPVNIMAYRQNRVLLAKGLRSLGYDFVEPQGAFYLWVKALEPDAKAFCEKAKDFELLLVPSNGFGVTGWVRISYCVSEKTIVDAMPAFEKLIHYYRQDNK